MDPDRATVDTVIARVRKSLAGYLSDPEFLDLLRVTELAIERGKLSGEDIPELRRRIANEFPSKDLTMNRELVRLLAALHERARTRGSSIRLKTRRFRPKKKFTWR